MKIKNNKRIFKLVTLAVLCLLLGVGGFNFSYAEENLPDSTICAVYFTFIGCPNCAYTDPVVLTEWPQKYKNLVVVEYGWIGGDFKDVNSQFYGEYSSKYRVQAAVPSLALNKLNIKLGRNNVPSAEKDIKSLKSNPCLLKNGAISFENLRLNELQARPKIWANERILIRLGENEWLFQWNGEKIPEGVAGKEEPGDNLLKSLLFTDNLSKTLQGIKFDAAETQKAEFSGIAFPGSDFIPYADFGNAIKIKISVEPTVIETPSPAVLESAENQPIEEEPVEEEVKIPLLGEIKTEQFSLPVLTILLGLADGFNPCAFFVLTFLLAALIGFAGARKKIFLVGGIFVFFSAFFYFLFMVLLLNVFKLGQGISILTVIAGSLAIFAGVINIKDYFVFQKGVSLTLPKSYKEKFIERVKKLSLVKSTWALIVATTVIACTVNIYELLCTVGFPMIFTRVLTLRKLTSLNYYLYLIFYNLVYIVPLVAVVIVFAATLGRKTFTQIWVRRLKLVSGLMILFLGLILALKPKLLESVYSAFLVLILAILISGVIILIFPFREKKS